MNPGSSHTEKSEELVIDTHKGKEEGIILPEDNQSKEEEITTITSVILERITNKTINIDEINNNNIDEEKEKEEKERLELQQKLQKEKDILEEEILKKSSLPVQHQVEAIAGIGAAFVVFIVLLIWRWRNKCVTSPHVKLVEDDFLTSDLFKGKIKLIS